MEPIVTFVRASQAAVGDLWVLPIPYPPLSDEELDELALAFHEAAHAVVAVRLGMAVHYACLWFDADRRRHVGEVRIELEHPGLAPGETVRPPSSAIERCATVLAAGTVGQRLLTGDLDRLGIPLLLRTGVAGRVSVQDDALSAMDFAMLERLALLAGRDGPEELRSFIQEAERRAGEELERGRLAIWPVARRLWHCGYIHGDEVAGRVAHLCP